MSREDDGILKVAADFLEVDHEYPVLRGHVEGIHQRFKRIKLRAVDANPEQVLAAGDGLRNEEPHTAAGENVLNSSNVDVCVQYNSDAFDLFLDRLQLAEFEGPGSADIAEVASAQEGSAQRGRSDCLLTAIHGSRSAMSPHDTVLLGGAYTNAPAGTTVAYPVQDERESQGNPVRQLSLQSYDDAHYFPGVPAPPREAALAVPEFLLEPSVKLIADGSAVMQPARASSNQPGTKLLGSQCHRESYVSKLSRDPMLTSHWQIVSTGHGSPERQQQQFGYNVWHVGCANTPHSAERPNGGLQVGGHHAGDAQFAMTRNEGVPGFAASARLAMEMRQGGLQPFHHQECLAIDQHGACALQEQCSMPPYIPRTQYSGDDQHMRAAVVGHSQSSCVTAAATPTPTTETLDWIRLRQQWQSAVATTSCPLKNMHAPSHQYMAAPQGGTSLPGTVAGNAVYEGFHTGRAGLVRAQPAATQHSHGQVLPCSFSTPVSMNGREFIATRGTVRPSSPNLELPGIIAAHAGTPVIQSATDALGPCAFALPNHVHTSAHVKGLQGMCLPHGRLSAPSPVEASKLSVGSAPRFQAMCRYGQRPAMQVAREVKSRYTDSVSPFVAQLNSGSAAFHASMIEQRGAADVSSFQSHNQLSQNALRARCLLRRQNFPGDFRVAGQAPLHPSYVHRVQHRFTYTDMDICPQLPAGRAAYDDLCEAGPSQPSSILCAQEASQQHQQYNLSRQAALMDKALAVPKPANVDTCGCVSCISNPQFQHGTHTPAAISYTEQIRLTHERPEDGVISQADVPDVYCSVTAVQKRGPGLWVKGPLDRVPDHIGPETFECSKHTSACSSAPQLHYPAPVERKAGKSLQLPHSGRFQSVAAELSPPSIPRLLPDAPGAVPADSQQEPEPYWVAAAVARVEASTRCSRTPVSGLEQTGTCELPMMPYHASTACARKMHTGTGGSVVSIPGKVANEALSCHPTSGKPKTKQPQGYAAAELKRPQVQCTEDVCTQEPKDKNDETAAVCTDPTQGAATLADPMRTDSGSAGNVGLQKRDWLAATATCCQCALEDGKGRGRHAATGEVQVRQSKAEGDPRENSVSQDPPRQDASAIACQDRDMTPHILEGQVHAPVYGNEVHAQLDRMDGAVHQEQQNIAQAISTEIAVCSDNLPVPASKSSHITIEGMPRALCRPEDATKGDCPRAGKGDTGRHIGAGMQIAAASTDTQSEVKTLQTAATAVTTGLSHEETEAQMPVSEANSDHADPCLQTDTVNVGVIPFKRYRLQLAVETCTQKRQRTKLEKEQCELGKADHTQAYNAHRVTRQHRSSMGPVDLEAAATSTAHHEDVKRKVLPSQVSAENLAITDSIRREGTIDDLISMSKRGISHCQIANSPEVSRFALQRASVQREHLAIRDLPSRLSGKSILISRRLLPDPRCLSHGCMTNVHSRDDSQSGPTGLAEQQMRESDDH